MIRRERELLEAELQCATYLGRATHCKADIYTFDGARSPCLMSEVWRLRDLAFRQAGVALQDSANGCASDCDGSCRQLIVWDGAAREIVGGYRYALGAEVAPESLSIWRYFTLSPRFINDYIPSALELGDPLFRPNISVVQPIVRYMLSMPCGRGLVGWLCIGMCATFLGVSRSIPRLVLGRATSLLALCVISFRRTRRWWWQGIPYAWG